MTNVKDHSESFILRLDEAVDGWLKQHLPVVHRFVSWHAERMSRVKRRTAWSVGLIILIVLITSLIHQT